MSMARHKPCTRTPTCEHGTVVKRAAVDMLGRSVPQLVEAKGSSEQAPVVPTTELSADVPPQALGHPTTFGLRLPPSASSCSVPVLPSGGALCSGDAGCPRFPQAFGPDLQPPHTCAAKSSAALLAAVCVVSAPAGPADVRPSEDADWGMQNSKPTLADSRASLRPPMTPTLHCQSGPRRGTPLR